MFGSHSMHVLRSLAILGTIFAAATVRAEDSRVVFDVPDKIECRDVTPAKCAALHPQLKVIEAKFRISASFASGNEASAVDFTYMISSPQMRLKVLDYLPNTTLESRYADDRIEVADFSEEGNKSTQEALVGYSIFSLSAMQSQFNRKTEENHYQRVAPKSLVLASGTMNRGHGVFYKLRPSNSASLEGAKEFTFLAVVPRKWRADWCTFVCSARSEKKSLLGTTVVPSGLMKVDVGLYLCGDEAGNKLSVELCSLQEQNDGAVVKHSTAEAAKAMETTSTLPKGIQLVGHVDDLLVDLLKLQYAAKAADGRLTATLSAVTEVEAQLGKLAGVE